jgi:hypothetical protein
LVFLKFRGWAPRKVYRFRAQSEGRQEARAPRSTLLGATASESAMVMLHPFSLSDEKETGFRIPSDEHESAKPFATQVAKPPAK